MAELYWTLQQRHLGEFPNIIKLAQLGLTLPVHTADVESCFSLQNIIMSPLRNTTSIKHQNMLMRVHLEGTKKGDSDSLDLFVQKSIDQWSKDRKRTLFGHNLEVSFLLETKFQVLVFHLTN